MTGRTVATASLKPLMWNEPDARDPDRPRDADEHLEQRRHRKRLKDCSLPEGFRLVTPEPKQFWLDGQVRYAFQLAWGFVDANGRRIGDEWNQVFRYEEGIPDDFQIQWAVEDFGRELEAAGCFTQPAKPKVAVEFSLRVAALRGVR